MADPRNKAPLSNGNWKYSKTYKEEEDKVSSMLSKALDSTSNNAKACIPRPRFVIVERTCPSCLRSESVREEEAQVNKYGYTNSRKIWYQCSMCEIENSKLQQNKSSVVSSRVDSTLSGSTLTNSSASQTLASALSTSSSRCGSGTDSDISLQTTPPTSPDTSPTIKSHFPQQRLGRSSQKDAEDTKLKTFPYVGKQSFYEVPFSERKDFESDMQTIRTKVGNIITSYQKKMQIDSNDNRLFIQLTYRGHDYSSAVPTLTVGCNSRRSIKPLTKLIRKSNLLEFPISKRTVSLKVFPTTYRKVNSDDSGSDVSDSEDEYDVTAKFRHNGERACGLPLSCRVTRKTATLGGIIKVDRSVYAVTAGHLFDIGGNSDCDQHSTSDSGSDGLSDKGLGILTKATLERRVKGSDGLNRRNTRLVKAYDEAFGPQAETLRVGGLHYQYDPLRAREVPACSSQLDYALIHLDGNTRKSFAPFDNSFTIPVDEHRLKPQTVQIVGVESVPHREGIWILGPDGPIEARISPLKASLSGTEKGHWIDVWCVTPKTPGDYQGYSGSWVVRHDGHGATAAVYGHIIGRHTSKKYELRHLYVVPMNDVLHHLSRFLPSNAKKARLLRPSKTTTMEKGPQRTSCALKGTKETFPTPPSSSNIKKPRASTKSPKPAREVPPAPSSSSHGSKSPASTESPKPFSTLSEKHLTPSLIDKFPGAMAGPKATAPLSGTAKPSSTQVRKAINEYNNHVSSCDDCQNNTEGIMGRCRGDGGVFEYALESIFDKEAQKIWNKYHRDGGFRNMDVVIEGAEGKAKEMLSSLNMRLRQSHRRQEKKKNAPFIPPAHNAHYNGAQHYHHPPSQLSQASYGYPAQPTYMPHYASHPSIGHANMPHYPSLNKSTAREGPYRR